MEEVVRRDVHGPHDPLASVAEVEHVHARRRLLEVTEEHPLPGERVGEDRAVDAAVQDGERVCQPSSVTRRSSAETRSKARRSTPRRNRVSFGITPRKA
jgi:hypothetical protein